MVQLITGLCMVDALVYGTGWLHALVYLCMVDALVYGTG
jgi:hypothetical protein